MGKQETIKAMKGNLEAEFSQMVWDIGKLERHGWREVGVKSKAVEVDAKKIPIIKGEIKVEPIDAVKDEVNDDLAAKPKVSDSDTLYPSNDQIKDELREKGIKFHQALGTKKLRKLYEDSK